MAAVFKSYTRASIGTTTVTLLAPSVKSIVIGLTVSNIYGSVMPITIKLNKSGGGTVTHIAKSKRVESGSYLDFMLGNKLVVEVGDTITAFAGDTAAFDVSVSVLEGVS
jgi:hypothetical protein